MAHKKNAGSSVPAGNQSPFGPKKRVNQPEGGQKADTTGGASDQQHDAAGRQGSFEGKGEHARTGNRGRQ